MENNVSKTAQIYIDFTTGVVTCPSLDTWTALHGKIERVLMLANPEIRHHMEGLVRYMQPAFDGKLLSIYANADDLARGKRTIGKPAKLIRKFCEKPNADDLESFAVWFNDCALANDGLTVKTCTDAETFARIYKADIQTGTDARLGHDRKSLSSSCMRYEFNHLPHHPAWIYGSGDFTLAWVENSVGKVCARVVICTRTSTKTGLTCFVRAPIYTNSNAAADLLESWCDEQFHQATDKDKKTWLNARLLRVEVNDGFLAPYFDRDSSVRDNGDFLVVSRHGDLELSNTHGTVNTYAETCNSCGCGVDEYDSYYHENHDGVWCAHCFSDEFAMCECCQEYEPHDQTQDVDGDCVCDHCLEHSGNYVSTLADEWHHIDNVVFDVDGDAHGIDDDTWFESDVDGEIYNVDTEANLPTWFPDRMTIEQAMESGHWNRQHITRVEWLQRRFGAFRLPRSLYAHDSSMVGEGKHVTRHVVVWTLKDHLEWDGCEIVNNQLELFDA